MILIETTNVYIWVVDDGWLCFFSQKSMESLEVQGFVSAYYPVHEDLADSLLLNKQSIESEEAKNIDERYLLGRLLWGFKHHCFKELEAAKLVLANNFFTQELCFLLHSNLQQQKLAERLLNPGW